MIFFIHIVHYWPVSTALQCPYSGFLWVKDCMENGLHAVGLQKKMLAVLTSTLLQCREHPLPTGQVKVLKFCFHRICKIMLHTKISHCLQNGHVGTSHFVLYREIVFSLEVKMYCYNGEGTSKCVLYREVFSIVSFIWRVHYQRFYCILG